MKARTFLAMCFLTHAASAQTVQEAWVARYDGPLSQSDRAEALSLDRAGNVYITGVSIAGGTGSDILTIKYLPDGTPLWIARFEHPGVDQANDIGVDSLGAAYVTGFLSSTTGGGGEIATLKFNADGTLAWMRTFVVAAAQTANQGVKIALDAGGNALVGGEVWNFQSTPQSQDMVVLKYSPQGDLLWSAVIDGAKNFDALIDLGTDPAGNIAITGRSDSTGASTDILTLRLGPDGQVKWRRRYATAQAEDPNALDVDRHGDIFITGRGSGVGNDYLTLRYDSLGALRWADLRDFNLTQDEAFDILATDDAVYVTGAQGGFWGTVSYDHEGVLEWAERFDATESNVIPRPLALALDPDGDVYVTGYKSVAAPFGTTDYLTLKYAPRLGPDRRLAWAIGYNGTGNNNDMAVDIAVDQRKNVYITGRSFGAGTSEDMVTIKYGQSGTGGVPPACWLEENFENLQPGLLHGQNAWHAVPGRSSPVVVDNPFGSGQVLRLDPGPGQTDIIGKDVNDQITGKHRIALDVLVDGNLDDREPTLAKVEIRTKDNPGWDKKFQLYFGAHFRLNYGPTPASAAIFLPANELVSRRWYRVEAVVDLATDQVDMLLDGELKLAGIPVGPGAITDISVSAWDRPGAVYYDNLRFCLEGGVPPGDSCLASSFFDAGDEGWTVSGDAQGGSVIPDYFASGGNPGGYLAAKDNATGGIWYWNAPAAFRGDKSCAYGRALDFDLRQSDTGSQFNAADVILAGGGLVLVFDTPYNPGTDWTAYSIHLHESAGWRMGSLNGAQATQQDLLAVLGALDSLKIRGEFRNGTDTGSLDNVILGGPQRGVGPLAIARISVDDGPTAPSQGDGDGIPEAGEMMAVAVDLRNTGILGANGIRATLSTADSDLTISRADANYPDLAPDSAGTGTPAFVVSINAALAGQRVVVFQLTATAANGGPWASTFEMALGQKPGNKILVVDTPLDESDGECDEDCSLRDAILLANENLNLNSTTPDSIRFAIDQPGVVTIAPLAPLPAITEAVAIDGLSQPGGQCAEWPPRLLIELDGSHAGANANGLSITAGSATIRGLIINRFSRDGLLFDGSGLEINRVFCNFIGTDSTGTVALGNGDEGIEMYSAQNLIGGPAPGQRNLISGNGDNGILLWGGAVIQGNFIGTDVTGTQALGNGRNGVESNEAAETIVGGSAAGAGNVISANLGHGIEVTANSEVVIEGNLIGTDVTGLQPLGNARSGIFWENVDDSDIGGENAGQGNTVRFNGEHGIAVENSDAENRIVNNLIGDNSRSGLSVVLAKAQVVRQNAVIGNGEYGIAIASGETRIAQNTISLNDSSGIRIDDGEEETGGNKIEENTIRHNGGHGVRIVQGGGNAIHRNRIFANQGLGIDLLAVSDPPSGVTANDSLDADAGPNRLMNHPEITSAAGSDSLLIVSLLLASEPLIDDIRIELFASGVCNADTAGIAQGVDYGEGEFFLIADSVSTSGEGQASLRLAFVPPVAVPVGSFITATATFPDGSTSEFSPCRIVEKTTAIVSDEGPVITMYALQQNYPNPFNPGTEIRYHLPEAAAVSLRIYDLAGRLVRELEQEARKPAGAYRATWDGRDALSREVPSGVYFYRLSARDSRETVILQRKMVRVK